MFDRTAKAFSRIKDKNDPAPYLFIKEIEYPEANALKSWILKFMATKNHPTNSFTDSPVQKLSFTLRKADGSLAAIGEHHIKHERKTIGFGGDKCEAVTLRYQGYYWVIVINDLKEEYERNKAEREAYDKLQREGLLMRGISDDGDSKTEARDMTLATLAQINCYALPGYWKLGRAPYYNRNDLEVNLTKNGVDIDLPYMGSKSTTQPKS